MQLVISKVLTVSITIAGDFKREEPYIARSVNETLTVPVKLIRADLTASGTFCAYGIILSIVSILKGPVAIKLSPPSIPKKSVNLLLVTLI